MPARADLSSREESLSAWADPVTRVRLVDGSRAESLEKLGVRTVGDLIWHFPHRYLDLRETPDLASVRPGEDATVVGRVHEIKVKRPRKGLNITEVAIVDGKGVLLGVWFNQPYMADRFKVGDRVAFAGKVTLDYGLKQIRNPMTERLDADSATDHTGSMIPLHPATEGLSANWLRRLVWEALEQFGDVPDVIPTTLRAARNLSPLSHALSAIHSPQTPEQAERARKRLVYEELFLLQLLVGIRRRERQGGSGISHVTDGPARTSLEDALPFSLTEDQRVAVSEVLTDMAAPQAMNRLLLGDVGTGKTAVAAIALAAAADGSHQAAMMAPTSVLASQYAQRVGPLLDKAGIGWVLLTGATPAAERKLSLAALYDGTASVALGTHALFSEDVVFDDLGLVIVDEQHRFGVEQRLALREKGRLPDMLVMTATPIPRSLAMTVHGDLDTTYLRQRPTGRQAAEAVKTELVRTHERAAAYEKVREAAARGRQAYVICALVEGDADSQAKAVTSEATRLRRDVFPDLSVGLLHGRMSPDEKSEAMGRFIDGLDDILVSTTVVEVGVDVPNAVVMLIEDAERFGLAQLHQLRGRVSRGEDPGLVMLFSDPVTDEGRRRMHTIASMSDGFDIAEADLVLRGEGDILGSRQSGRSGLRIASLLTDMDVLEDAKLDVDTLLGAGDGAALLGPAILQAHDRFGDFDRWAVSG